VSQLHLLPPPPPVPPAESDEFYTPPSVFEPLHREFSFTLDACATAESAKCPRFFTQAQDGLAQPWAPERVWMNPPYNDIAPWTAKALEEARRGALVVGLLPAWTDRAWWHEHIEPFRPGLVKLRFIRGRVRFGYPGNPTGRGGGGGMFPSVLVIWGRP
jgi:site-specific DNA-methyltransferase (adenine-specific)